MSSYLVTRYDTRRGERGCEGMWCGTLSLRSRSDLDRSLRSSRRRSSSSIGERGEGKRVRGGGRGGVLDVYG